MAQPSPSRPPVDLTALAESGIASDRRTDYRRVQRFPPLFQQAARAHRHPVGDRRRVDETCCRVQGS
jgi:transposase-like protein